MNSITLATICNNADGTITEGTITVDPNAPKLVRPKPTTINAAAFYARFTDAEKAGIAVAAVTAPAIFVGLIHGLANSTVDLAGAELKTWMDGLVAADAITADREMAILTP